MPNEGSSQDRGGQLPADLLQIGQAADVVGLSLRTIRHYEEMGLVTPSGRSAGGFRLFNADDIDRLFLIKRMKPLGYSLQEMAALLSLVDALAGSEAADIPPAEALSQLRAYADAVAERVVDLETKVAYAKEFRQRILDEIARRTQLAGEHPAAPGDGHLVE